MSAVDWPAPVANLRMTANVCFCRCSRLCCLRLVNHWPWGEPLRMTTQPVLFPVLLAADTDPLMRAVAAYLARFKDATRVHAESDLPAFLLWCSERRLPPLRAQRVHVEL